MQYIKKFLSDYLMRLEYIFFRLLRFFFRIEFGYKILAIYIRFRIKPLGATKSRGGPKLLLLHHGRFKDDVRVINEKTSLTFYPLDMYLFRYINSIYLTNSVIIEFHKYIDNEKSLKNYICGSKIVDEAFWNQVNLIAKVLGQLKKNKIINAITSPNFSYLHDQTWQYGANLANVPFVALHKECNRDKKEIQRFSEIYKKYSYPFKGKYISVYNENEKKCIVNSGIASGEQVVVNGCPRQDDSFDYFNNSKFPRHNNYVTFFSFRPLIAGMRTKDENHRGFSKSGGGFEELFNKSHAAFAELAIQNSEIKFVIKLKYKSSWYEKIDMAIKKYCQKNGRYSKSYSNIRN